MEDNFLNIKKEIAKISQRIKENLWEKWYKIKKNFKRKETLRGLNKFI